MNWENSRVMELEQLMATILVVEDEMQLGRLIVRELEAAGFNVRHVPDGAAALEVFAEEPPDVVVLDWMLPGLDGLEVLRRLRQSSPVPVLMLTARAEEVDRVIGLKVGADDYLTKPFGARELIARVRALLRRQERLQVELTRTEFGLLHLLLRNQGRAFSREYLRESVWGEPSLEGDRSVDNAVLRLRKKLGPLGNAIETVWGVGYRLRTRP
jgi:DNA-binding response OmpR family regulator